METTEQQPQITHIGQLWAVMFDISDAMFELITSRVEENMRMVCGTLQPPKCRMVIAEFR